MPVSSWISYSTLLIALAYVIFVNLDIIEAFECNLFANLMLGILDKF
jgi:hypothetical protein